MKVTYTIAELRASTALSAKIAEHFDLPSMSFNDLLQQLTLTPNVAVSDKNVTITVEEEKFLAVVTLLDDFSDTIIHIIKVAVPLLALFKSTTRALDRRITALFKEPKRMNVSVRYNHKDSCGGYKDFDDLHKAVAFADGVIEDGGHAHVEVDTAFDRDEFAYALCDIHVTEV